MSVIRKYYRYSAPSLTICVAVEDLLASGARLEAMRGTECAAKTIAPRAAFSQALVGNEFFVRVDSKQRPSGLPNSRHGTPKAQWPFGNLAFAGSANCGHP